MMNQEEMIIKGSAEVISADSLLTRIKSGKKLKVKLGVDPTAPDLHLGHVVVLKKLKDFLKIGAEVIFLIGDYTVKIGDPSGKSKTRPVLSEEEIAKNTQTYLDQVGKILDVSTISVRKNSEWYEKISLAEIIKMAGKMTVASILERDDFAKRYKSGGDIGLHELFYPLMQAYDSVKLEADVELGGTDQKFNLLAGRELMKKMGLPPQEIITMPLLIGTDGTQKMSKSLGNYIALNEKPEEIYGKVMSIPDELIASYYELVTDVTDEGLAVIKKELEDSKNPRDIKARLAFLIVELIYNQEQADLAQTEFDQVFKNKELPSEIPQINIVEKEMKAIDLLAQALVVSKSEAKRLIEQNAVSLDNEKVNDPFSVIEIKEGMIIKSGRKFVKISK